MSSGKLPFCLGFNVLYKDDQVHGDIFVNGSRVSVEMLRNLYGKIIVHIKLQSDWKMMKILNSNEVLCTSEQNHQNIFVKPSFSRYH